MNALFLTRVGTVLALPQLWETRPPVDDIMGGVGFVHLGVLLSDYENQILGPPSLDITRSGTLWL